MCSGGASCNDAKLRDRDREVVRARPESGIIDGRRTLPEPPARSGLMACERVLAITSLLSLGLALGCGDRPAPAAVAPGIVAEQGAFPGARRIQRVLLLSVDGLHASDVRRYVAEHPASAFAMLSRQGVTFANASSAKPSDSYPGLLAIITGGSP